MIETLLAQLDLQMIVRRLYTDRRGNVLMIFGLSLIPLMIGLGMAVDYSRAARSQTRLNAAADAAALVAVTQPMMLKSDTVARNAAIAMFNTQAAAVRDVVYNPADLTVTVTTSGGAVSSRNVTVAYTATSRNVFAGILKNAAVIIGGTSGAKATVAPNIDFYLLLDTSPSMALPATTTGLNQMNTGVGCAFACHQTDLSGPDTVRNSSNTANIDYYTYAKTQGIVLRNDLVHNAVVDLVDVANSVATSNNATYRMALSQFDYRYQAIVGTPTTPNTIRSRVDDAQLLIYCRNNERVCGSNDNDTATNFTAAFNGALGTLPVAPGNGTKSSGDTPQAVLFIVTDGARDENRPGGRPEGPISTSQCTTIKNRGVRIAILYTEYLRASLNARDAGVQGWVNANFRSVIDPNNTLEPALTSCASAGLFYKVTTDGDISAALTALFRQAIASPRLVQ